MSLRKGTATITVASGKSIDLRKPAELIEDGGWTPGKLTIKAKGRFEEVDGKTFFRIAGTGESLELVKKHEHKSNESGLFIATGQVEFDGTRMKLTIEEVTSEP